MSSKSKRSLQAFTNQLDALKGINKSSICLAALEPALSDAVDNAPVLTGELTDSGGIVEADNGAEIVFTAPHAVHVEFGTYKMAAQPFLRPAIDSNESAILKEIVTNTQKQMKELIR